MQDGRWWGGGEKRKTQEGVQPFVWAIDRPRLVDSSLYSDNIGAKLNLSRCSRSRESHSWISIVESESCRLSTSCL
jgi:hypothetical protein